MKYTLTTILVYLFFICSNIFGQNQDEWKIYLDSAIQETSAVSLKYSNKLLEIATSLNDNELIARSYIELAFDYNRLGNYNSALDCAFSASKFFNMVKNDTRNYDYMIYINSLIGNIYMNLKETEKSNKYFRKAISLNKPGEGLLTLAVDYTNIGENFRLIQNFDSALFYFSIADSLYKAGKTKERKLSLSNCNLGLAHLGKGNFQQADSLLKLALDYNEKKKNYYVLCIIYYELSKSELKQNNRNKAKSLALKMLTSAQMGILNDQLRDGHLLMHDIAVLEKDYKSANQHLRQHYIFKDSLINTKVVSQMAEQRAEFEIDRKQDEVDYFKAISKARTTIAFILSIGLFSIIGLAIFLFRANKKRKAANLELKDKNKIIEHQLEEKDILMKEIHHRVKNNLQIISSIISLQNMRISDKEIQEIFTEMQRRITAISSIHQKLYQGSSISQINMQEYLGEVVESIHTAFNNKELNVNYEILVQNVKLNVDYAVSIGLIVNELTTNAYKYAFSPQKNNQFLVSLSMSNSGCTLTVSDNGPGIPADKDILKSDSLGIRMVNLLSRQMKGQLQFSSEQGAKFDIFFEGMQTV